MRRYYLIGFKSTPTRILVSVAISFDYIFLTFKPAYIGTYQVII